MCQIRATLLSTAALIFIGGAVQQGAQAVPMANEGKPARSSEDESPAGREFRAGIQAQVRGDLASARSRFEAALRLDPRYVPALLGLAGVAQTEGKPQQVEALLRRAEQAGPKSAEVQIAWGRHFLRNNQFDKAESAFLRARELAPQSIPPLLELGEVYLRMPGRAQDAVAVYRTAVELDGNNRYALYGYGVALAATGRRQEAVGALEKASQLTPKDPAALRAIGRVYLETGDLDKALAAFDRGLARQPGFVPLMLDRADVLARMGRQNDAIAQMLAAEKLAPKSAEVKVRLADVYQAAKRWDEAESAYRSAITLAPKSPVAYNNLAWVTVSRGGDAKRAVELARKAVELSPKSSPFYDTLGWAQHAAGDLRAAEMSLMRAIELEPNVASYYSHLGVVQRELKQTNSARASFQRAIELDPTSPQAEEIRKWLKELPAQQ